MDGARCVLWRFDDGGSTMVDVLRASSRMMMEMVMVMVMVMVMEMAEP